MSKSKTVGIQAACKRCSQNQCAIANILVHDKRSSRTVALGILIKFALEITQAVGLKWRFAWLAVKFREHSEISITYFGPSWPMYIVCLLNNIFWWPLYTSDTVWKVIKYTLFLSFLLAFKMFYCFWTPLLWQDYLWYILTYHPYSAPCIDIYECSLSSYSMFNVFVKEVL